MKSEVSECSIPKNPEDCNIPSLDVLVRCLEKVPNIFSPNEMVVKEW